MLRRIDEGEFRINQWAGGLTRQLAIGPSEARYEERNFLWRISSATVELEESDFTALPDYERYLSVLEGEIFVRHGDEEEKRLQPGEIDVFDGGCKTHSRGRCIDFNLMVRKGQCSGGLFTETVPQGEHFFLPVQRGEGEHIQLVYCVRGNGCLKDGNEEAVFKEGEAVLMTEPEKPELLADSDVVVMVAQVCCFSQEGRAV